MRATRYPNYFDYNLVRVERDPRMSVEELVCFTDEALAGLGHRRIDVEDIAAAESLRAGFKARGWKTMRLLCMSYHAGPAPRSGAPVEEASYDAMRALRIAWHREDFPDQDAGEYHQQARDVALS